MNKSSLKAKWSKYCDTDQLVDDTIVLLNNYGHVNSEHGVCALLDKYFTQKEPLIKLFATSGNYAGNMRIVLKKKFARQISRNLIDSFFCGIHAKLHTNELLKFADSDGKSIFDYLMTGKTDITIEDLPNAECQNTKKAKLSKFSYSDFSTIESHDKLSDVSDYMRQFNAICMSKLPNDIVFINKKDTPKLKAGTKTSRAFNKVCQHYGVDKLAPQTETVERDGNTIVRTVYPYDKVFAEYSDLVSDLEKQMYYVISLNPLDYLTMSIGVNWHSCHHLKGQWKGGCLSYMLDSTSMVTYVIEKMEEPVHLVPKVYRQMFHYDNNLFVQNRLYPQGNDGAVNLYEKFRGFVREEFAKLLGVDNQWIVNSGVEECDNHIESVGVHYKDYQSRQDCAVFYPASKETQASTHKVTIGHDGICVRCGKKYSSASRLFHQWKTDCQIDYEDDDGLAF